VAQRRQRDQGSGRRATRRSAHQGHRLSSAPRPSPDTSTRRPAPTINARQCFGGAKNHMIVMPDADMDQAVDALIGRLRLRRRSAAWRSRSRCPSARRPPTILMDKLIPRVESLKIGPSTDTQAITGRYSPGRIWKRSRTMRPRRQGRRQARRSTGAISSCKGYEQGHFMGGLPVRPRDARNRIYRKRFFRARCFRWCAQGLRGGGAVAAEHDYGNGVAIFTATATRRAISSAALKSAWSGVNFGHPRCAAYYTFGGGNAPVSAISTSTAPTRCASIPNQDGDPRAGRRA